MAVDVAANERAQRHHRLAERPLGTEGALRQGGTEALALEAGIDLGVHEVHPATAAVVDGEAGELAVECDLVAVLVGGVDDGGNVGHGSTLGPPAPTGRVPLTGSVERL